jgi:hypothetical protein
MLQARNTHLVPSHADHLPSQKSDLRRKRQILWADIMASKQRHAAKDAVVVADQLVKIVVAPLVTRVEAKARDLVEPDTASRKVTIPQSTELRGLGNLLKRPILYATTGAARRQKAPW